MATTTPNYGWDVPTSTDYVKDGATAIETLGDDIDASLFSITNGRNVGLSLITSATIGSGVTAINVDSVFSSAFRNYQIVINGSLTSTVDSLEFRVRDGGGTIATNTYSFMGMEMNTGAIGTITARGSASTSFARVGTTGGSTSPSSFNSVIYVCAPNLAQPTNIISSSSTNAQGAIATVANWGNGNHFGSTVCTGFAIVQGGGATFTGGTIQVYGLRTT